MLAQEPRAITAWRRGWECGHFQRLMRWRDRGLDVQTVYDIGAHKGDWAEMCHAIFSPRHSVLFEPQQEFLEQARSKPACRDAQWQLLPVALGDKEGVAVLNVTQTRAAASLLTPMSDGDLKSQTQCRHQLSVPVAPLDLLVKRERLPPPDLVKIDVQGFESAVIAGGVNTLKHAECMVIETSLRSIYEGQSFFPDVLRQVTDAGFQLEDINDAVRTWPDGRLWQVDLWLKRKH